MRKKGFSMSLGFYAVSWVILCVIIIKPNIPSVLVDNVMLFTYDL